MFISHALDVGLADERKGVREIFENSGPHFLKGEFFMPAPSHENLEILEELQITVTLLRNMAKAAISGFRMPAAASGIPKRL